MTISVIKLVLKKTAPLNSNNCLPQYVWERPRSVFPSTGSPVLPHFEGTTEGSMNYTTPFSITKEEGSGIGAMLAIGALISAVPSGYLAECFGRKKCIIGFFVPIAIFTVLVCVARNAYTLYIARIFSGIATAGIFVVSPMYIAEIAEVSVRGTMSSVFELLIYVGVMFTAFTGSYLHYIPFTLLLAATGLVLAIAFFFMPESPTYLMKKGRRHEAQKALAFYRSNTYDLNQELDRIQKQMDEMAKTNANCAKLITSKAAIRGLICSVGLTCFQQLGGNSVVTFYTVNLFQEAGTSMNAYTSSMIACSMEVVAAVIVVFIMERAGRRTFLYISSIGMCICHFILATYFTMKAMNITFCGMGAIPLATLICYIFFFAMGMGPIPWLVNGELFAAEIKGPANGITVTTNWIVLFAITKTFPTIAADLGPNYAFYMYSAFLALCAIFVRFFVPETRGKTLQQIQEELSA